jgi:hypothetical protein
MGPNDFSKPWLCALLTLIGGIATVSVLASSARAQCVQADISMQYNISGSKEPTQRSNEVEMNSSNTCTGNASATTGVQGNIGGTAPVEQHRTVRQTQTGGMGNPTGVNVPTVKVKTNATADIYNSADRFRRR